MAADRIHGSLRSLWQKSIGHEILVRKSSQVAVGGPAGCQAAISERLGDVSWAKTGWSRTGLPIQDFCRRLAYSRNQQCV